MHIFILDHYLAAKFSSTNNIFSFETIEFLLQTALNYYE